MNEYVFVLKNQIEHAETEIEFAKQSLESAKGSADEAKILEWNNVLFDWMEKHRALKQDLLTTN